MENGYYIPASEENHFAVIGHFCQCKKCGRKFVVEMALIGTIHHHNPVVICTECLELNEEFDRKWPEIAKQIEAWKTS